MASYVTGYDDERFEHVVSQSFHCIICTNVFKDPVMCRHNEHLFCRGCITIHLMNSQTCPNCMEPLTVDTLIQAPRGIRNILSELKIRCEFFERGCETFVELGDLERHVEDCEFAPAVCSACDVAMNKRDLVHHEAVVCKVRRLKCRSCNELKQEMDIVKFSLAAIHEKLLDNEKRNKMDMKVLEQNLVAKVSLVQEKLSYVEVYNRHHQVETKKSLKEITQQLKTITLQASHDQVQDKEPGYEVGKAIEEVDEFDGEPKVVVAGRENVDVEINSVEMFSLSTQTWTAQLQAMEECRCGASSVVFNNQIVVAGGENVDVEINSVEMFSLSTQTWMQLQPMEECRCGASSVVFNNQIVVAGGLDNDGTTYSMERLSTNTVHVDQFIPWEKFTAKLPVQSEGHCSVVYDGRLIVIGGCNSENECFDSIKEVSLAPPHATKLLAIMPQTRCYHGAAVFGDKIVIVGGSKTAWPVSAVESVIMYDITKNECMELATLPYPVSEIATVKWGDDNLIIMGGADSNYKPLNKVLIYNVQTQKSHMLPDMKYKRQGCVAAVVRDTVIVMGGRDEKVNYLKSVESFRLDRYSWEELPDMHEARSWATAVTC